MVLDERRDGGLLHESPAPDLAFTDERTGLAKLVEGRAANAELTTGLLDRYELRGGFHSEVLQRVVGRTGKLPMERVRSTADCSRKCTSCCAISLRDRAGFRSAQLPV